MIDDRLSAVQRLFDEAAQVAAADREAFLAEACGKDAALHSEVASLLQCAEGVGNFLNGQAIDRVLTVPRGGSDPAELIGRSIGAYRIEKLIGAGGMGVVYLARQSDPQRFVALKLIRPELATPRLVRRLHDEAQVLGRLLHPGIAQIHEAGCASAELGPQPFFAMEYVPGATLVQHANARNLSINERLELLARVCDALHHAHQHGVIHRDLKPQNILVVDTDDADRAGQPKIIDFGVARVVDSAGGTPVDRTTVDRLVGTLSYMSPEQFDDPRNGVDIRSDIYAVGVIGYELLTGQLPHDLRDRSIAEAVRTIAESNPTPLSTQSRALRGDVEIIVMTALAKEKTRRYQSASSLGADIRRCLRGEPITARPPSFWYELSRHAKRNKLVYAALVLAFLLLLAGTIGTSIGVLRARANALAMEQAFGESEAVTTFVERMIGTVDPHQLSRRDVPMREVLGRMSEALEGEFAERPLLRARLHHFVGLTLRGVGLPKEGEPHLRKAVAIRESMLGADAEATLASKEVLGSVTRDLGTLEESVQLLTAVSQGRERLLGPDHADTIHACRELSLTYYIMDRQDDAEALLIPAWERARRVFGDRHQITLDLAEGLVGVRAEQGKSGQAPPFCADVHQACLEALGESHPLSLRAGVRLVDELLWQGRFEDAEHLARRTYELARAALDDGHLQTLSAAFSLGRTETELGRFEEANRLFTVVIEAWRAEFGDDNRNTLMAVLGQVRSLRGLGRFEEASSIVEEALQTSRRALGADHGVTLAAMQMQATAFYDLKQYDQACPLFAELLQSERRLYSENDARALRTMHNLAAALSFDETRLDEAASMFEQVLEIRRGDPGPRHPHTLKTASWLGHVYYLQGRYEEARAILQETVDIARAALPVDHFDLGVNLRRLGTCLRAMQRYEEAQAALSEALRILELRLGANHDQTAEARAELGKLAEIRTQPPVG